MYLTTQVIRSVRLYTVPDILRLTVSCWHFIYKIVSAVVLQEHKVMTHMKFILYELSKYHPVMPLLLIDNIYTLTIKHNCIICYSFSAMELKIILRELLWITIWNPRLKKSGKILKYLGIINF
jgi:hypothetical protein